MKIILTTNKEGLLWNELLEQLNRIANSYKFKTESKIIPFPLIFEGICRKFSINKQKAWNCLFFLAEFSLIEIIKFHGVKLNFKIKNGHRDLLAKNVRKV